MSLIAARLIIPQRSFCEKLGITDRFLVEEYCAALEFENVGKVVV